MTAAPERRAPSAAPERRAPSAAPPALLCLLLALAGACDDGAAARDGTPDAAPGEQSAAAERRPDRVSDTIRIEGMAEVLELRLFRTGEDFPLPFSAYVPEDMAVGEEREPAAVRFVGEFGGQRNEDVFVHFVVYPDTVAEAEALAMLRGFESGRGVPVGRGIEPLGGDEEPPPIPWAIQAYRFRYQAGGTWYVGTAALGRHEDRLFHIIRHYPAEYGDGFSPRAERLLESWRWADGAPLRPAGSGP